MASLGSCVAIIPARDFRTAKSRLAPVLPEQGRRKLGRWMFSHVLEVLRAVPSVGAAAVLSDADEVLSLAAAQGFEGIRCEAVDMNADLERGRAWALGRRVSALLVVPADLPLLSADEVESLIRAGAPAGKGEAGAAVLAPSPDGGTNGMFLRPAGALPFSFGAGSFRRHWTQAVSLGLRAVRFESEGFRCDVDTPADLALIQSCETIPAGWPLTPASP